MLKRRKQSIRTKIITAFLVVAILQAVAFFLLLVLTNVFGEVYKQSYSKYDFEAARTARLVQETFNGSRSGFLPVVMQMNQRLNAVVEHHGRDLEDLNETQIESLLTTGSEYIIEYLNSNKNVSGAFVILDTGTDSKDCVYIRDMSEVSGIRSASSKIYVRGPGSIAKENGFQLHYLWERKFDFGELDTESRKFFDNPVWASKSNLAYSDMFYWSMPFVIAKNENKAVTLTMPLLTISGEAYGVCGFELSDEFIKRNLPYTELGDARSAYALGALDLSGGLEKSVVNGPYISKLFAGKTKFYDMDGMESMQRIESLNTEVEDFICVTDELILYNKNSPFIDEKWAVHGFSPEKEVTAYPDGILRSIIIVQAVVLVACLLFSYITALGITNPIVGLSRKLADIDPESTVSLEKINITEIDDLTSALELLSREIASSSSRLSTIINIAGVPIGGYEHRYNDDNVYLTDLAITMFGLDVQSHKIPHSEFVEIFNSLGLTACDGYDDVYVMAGQDGTSKWFRMKSVKSDFSENVFAMDITQEILDLKRVEYERDHDSLTKLFNRKAFLREVSSVISEGKYSAGALILIDMDNLKFVNDTYGHDYGDRYICALAEALGGFSEEGGIISRMAGDEFTAYLPSDKGERDIREKLHYILAKAKSGGVELPNGGYQTLRFSTGVAWYPKDSSDVENLTKYADFAMYETKRGIKGTISEFDAAAYREKSISRESFEALDKILESALLYFVYQPIVDAVTGEVFAYEMLMRSNVKGLETPEKILSIAKTQTKLYLLEHLCANELADVLLKRSGEIGEKLIFFNTVSSIALIDEDLEAVVARCPDLFQRCVVEITESEDINSIVSELKLKQVAAHGFTLAVDNYRAGCNGETMMAKMNPHYVKISMDIVRGICSDPDKRKLTNDIIRYCSERGIKTIAEGVETVAEVETLMELGADYFQGFYFAEPKTDFIGIPDEKQSEIRVLAKRMGKNRSGA